MGFEPRAAGWKAQTNPLSYGGNPPASSLFVHFLLAFYIPLIEQGGSILIVMLRFDMH